MKNVLIIADPEAFFIGFGLFILIALVWIALDHYIFLPRRMSKIVAEIKQEAARGSKQA